MKGIIVCEESQAVTSEFNEAGHDFYSCDLQNCGGKYPNKHIKADAIEALTGRFHKGLHHVTENYGWQFAGAHTPCDFSANSGVRWLTSKKPLNGYVWSSALDIYVNPERWAAMEKMAKFFKQIYGIIKEIGKGYMEQPIIHKYAQNIIGVKPTQIIQPWQFGHGEVKPTLLWLINLPKLKPTNIVTGREQKIWKMPPSSDRKKLRSKTYPGIAKAMADQWG